MHTAALDLPRQRSGRIFWILQLGGWTAYAAALMVPWLGRYPVSAMWLNKLVIAGCGLATSCALRLLYRRIAGATTGPLALGGLVVIVSVAAAIVWNTAASAILGRPLHDDSVFLAALGTTWPRFDGVLYHALVLLSWSALYLGARHYRELVGERARSMRAEALAREARLLALRYQIGPHFLFNALNAISTLVVADRKHDATAAIARLADLLRVSLQPTAGGMIPLRSELQIVRDYVAIEQVRFAERLQVVVDVPGDALDVLVPVMVLQPLVENAIRHGVATRETPTCITIDADVRGDALQIGVHDDGPGSTTFSAGLGVGLTNVRARLDELYGVGRYAFVANSTPGGGFHCLVTLPRERAAEWVPELPSMEAQPA